MRFQRGCAKGSAVISTAGNLHARFVIHAVGPIWQGGQQGEGSLLQSAYRRALELASEHGCRSVAAPALSCGAYGFPVDQASRIALATTREFLEQDARVERVRFVLFSAGMYGAFAAALEALSR